MGRVGAKRRGGVACGEVNPPLFDSRINGIEHGIQFRLYLIVPEADDTVTLAFKPGRSFLVMTALSLETMLGAIHFDYQFQTMRNEIRKIDAQ